MKIAGCTALVTGANRGIGEGFVEALLDQGAARIYLCARSLADAEAAAARAPERLVPLALDVTKPDDIAAAAARCADLSLLINNAGQFRMQTLLRAPTMEAMREEMEVNCFGMIAMCRAFAPILKTNGGGAIANVLSAGAICPVPDMGGYSPSKFAARAATVCLRAELAPQGTQVTALIVGSVDTRMAAHVRRDKSQPRDIAEAALIAVEKGIDELDTDPHAIAVRADLARDPKGVERAMAARMARIAATMDA